MIDTKTAPYAALILRVALGTMLVAHALLKVLVFTLPGTVQFFESLGLPSALAYVTVGAELLGGVLLILGVGTRWVAAALVPVLIGATWYTRATAGCSPHPTVAGNTRVLDGHPDRPGPAR